MITAFRSINKLSTTLAAAALALGISGQTANAGVTALKTCAEIGTQTLKSYAQYAITLAAGEVLTYRASSISIVGPVLSKAVVVNGPATPTVRLNVGSEISCVVGDRSNDPGSIGAGFSANNQNRSINTGIFNNTRGRLANGGNQVTRNQVFISTQNLGKSQLETPEWNAWVSAEGRKYNGGLSGYSADVVVGADKLFSDNFLAGVLLSVDRTDVNGAAGRSVVTSQAVGAYFAGRFGEGLFLDGYLSFSNPKNETGGATFRSKRTMVALSLTGTHQTAAFMVRPFARITGYTEKQPAYAGGGGPVAANNVTSYAAAVGARFEPMAEFGTTGMKPYFSAELDHGYFNSTAAGASRFTYPRIGVGLSGPVGLGNLSLDLDGGKFNATTYDFGLRATYEFKF